MVYPIDSAGMRNMWAPYRIYLDHPICIAQEGQLTGTLVSAVTALPINGSVTVAGRTATTVNGNFAFDTFLTGTYSATASAPGYSDSTRNVTIVEGESTELNFALSPHLASGEYRIVLAWGENPRDLDSHLYTPQLADGSEHHIWYGGRGNLDVSPFANLDVDDTSGFGPETITISQGFDGFYSYKIHLFSGSGSIRKTSPRPYHS